MQTLYFRQIFCRGRVACPTPRSVFWRIRNYLCSENYRKNANNGFPILCRKVFHNKRTTLFSTVLANENKVVLFVENLYVEKCWCYSEWESSPYRKFNKNWNFDGWIWNPPLQNLVLRDKYAELILNTNKTIDKKSSHNPYMQDYARFFVWFLIGV